jgi:dTDP-4-amino-4,6-dideoxygalactose transaminase
MPTSNRSVLAAFADYFRKDDAGQMHLAGTGAVRELEQSLCRHYNVSHALCVSNATVGLLAVQLALELKNVEIITSPFTYGASVTGSFLLGNRVVFCDVDGESTLDPDSVRRAITSRTKAILATDLFGVPADMQRIRRIADDFGLWYIGDAAQSLGAYRSGLPASSAAHVWVLSFTTGKTVTAGEGGAILTNNQVLYERLVWLTQHPARQRRELGLHIWNEVSLNSRIHPLAAVWANAVLINHLHALNAYQDRCLELIDVLNEIGMTEPFQYRAKTIRPAFFKLTARWKSQPQTTNLRKELRNRGQIVNLCPLALLPLYFQPSLRTEFSHKYRVAGRCHRAEAQSRQSFCLTLRSQTENEL